MNNKLFKKLKFMLCLLVVFLILCKDAYCLAPQIIINSPSKTQSLIKAFNTELKAVGFDMNGTIIDTETIHREVFAEILYIEIMGLEKKYTNLQTGLAYYDKNVLGKQEIEILPQLIKEAQSKQPKRSFRSPQEYVKIFNSRTEERLNFILENDSENLLIKGIEPFILELKKMGMFIFLITISSPEKTKILWSKLKVFDLFDKRYVVSNYTEKISTYQKVLTKHKIAGQESFFLDDSPSFIEEAKATLPSGHNIVGIATSPDSMKRMEEIGIKAIIQDDYMDLSNNTLLSKVQSVIDNETPMLTSI